MCEKKEMCACGRGHIERDPETGVSLYSVWLEGSSFGRQEYGDCCKKCEEEQRKRLYYEDTYFYDW